MTMDEAMLKATAALDEAYAESLTNAADMADALGATPQEHHAFMQRASTASTRWSRPSACWPTPSSR